MNQTVTLEVFYPHSPARVWQALTDRRALAAWMMDNDFEPQLGHKFHFRQATLPGLDCYIACEVIELDPPKRLAYCWQESEAEYSTIITWTLTAVAGGTTLQLQHYQPVQTTSISPSVLLQRSRVMSNAMSYGKADDSPINAVMLGVLNADSESLQNPSSTVLASEYSLEQAEWHHRLIRLNQKLTSDTPSNLITESFRTENNTEG